MTMDGLPCSEVRMLDNSADEVSCKCVFKKGTHARREKSR